MLKKLAAYMKERASFEGVQWQLSDDFLQWNFDQGLRDFFGVSMAEDGVLLSDEQQPAFFKSYHLRSRS